MKINERGYWENPTAEGHGHDEGLANALVEFFKKENIQSVADVGCGTGYYLHCLVGTVSQFAGFDGNPHTSNISRGPAEFYIFGGYDFTNPDLNIGVYDWVYSLEVGEHIPEQYEDVFINLLNKSNRNGIILSWSIPEYGGDGHVNSRDNGYIINKICSLGYILDDLETERLRQSVAKYPIPCYWFSKTIMCFRKVSSDV